MRRAARVDGPHKMIKGPTPKSRYRPRSKYHAQPTMVDGIRFASKKEARRYGELKLLQRAGLIRGLMLQPRYGIRMRPLVGLEDAVLVATYVGDFQYWDADGAKVVEDVKGFKTPVYRLKKKLVEVQYGIQIREV